MDRAYVVIYSISAEVQERLEELPQELLVIGTTPQALRHARVLAKKRVYEVESTTLAWACGYLWNSIRDKDHEIARGFYERIFSTLVHFLSKEVDELFNRGLVSYDSAVLEARLLMPMFPGPFVLPPVSDEVFVRVANLAAYCERLIPLYGGENRTNFENDVKALEKLVPLGRRMYSIS